MNFFEHQDEAKRKTKWLVFNFVLAVISIIGAIYFLAIFANELLQARGDPNGYHPTVPNQWWQPTIMLYSATCSLLLIFGGSLFMTRNLSKGGSAVAKMLGGKRLHPETKDPKERRLRNVIEEMAIASGVPVPEIFILHEENSINAFAAGHTSSNAAIGVTRGTLETLNRDELQGVIAHEFSHILHGDMKINIRLMGILHGILMIAILGTFLIRSAGLGGGRFGSRQRKSSQATLAFMGAGMALIAIGYIGVFFGKLIKSALSRQREFLADASAVQYTRNPSGIASALKKIGGFSEGSKMDSPKAEEASHFFFENALSPAWLNALATHPPLEERIKRIDPSFSGTIPPYAAQSTSPSSTPTGASGFSSQGQTPTLPTQELITSIGAPSSKHLSYAEVFLTSLPEKIVQMSRSTDGAMALMYALLLDTQMDIQQLQLESVGQAFGSEVSQKVKELSSILDSLGTQARLPIIDLSLPSLRKMSKVEYAQFIKMLVTLIKADQAFDLHEMVLIKVIQHHLSPTFSKSTKKESRFRTFSSIQKDVHFLVSAFAYVGNSEKEQILQAFTKGWEKVSPHPKTILPFEEMDVSKLNETLDKLALASPSLKQEIILACTTTTESDGKLTADEAELLRAVGDTLNCPIPPMVAVLEMRT